MNADIRQSRLNALGPHRTRLGNSRGFLVANAAMSFPMGLSIQLPAHTACWRRFDPHQRRESTHAGMGLVELLLSAAGIAMVLGALILISDRLRNETCEQQTRQVMRKLGAALRQYHDRHGAWPPGATTATALQALQADQVTAPLLDAIGITTDPQGQPSIQDGYGTPIRYLIQNHDTESQADFVSAGPDGQFGDLRSESQALRSQVADNLYASDLETPVP